MPHNSSFSSKNEIGVLKSSCILIKKNLAHIVVSIDSIFPPILMLLLYFCLYTNLQTH